MTTLDEPVDAPTGPADPFVVAGVSLASRLLLGRWMPWALITAGVTGAIGTALLFGGDVLSGLFSWAVPLGLLAGGIVALLAWGKVGRK